MSLKTLTQTFPWSRYSKKLALRITQLRSAGLLGAEEAQNRGLRLVIGEEGKITDGNFIRFYWFVDKDDGGILDAKYQAFGQTALLGAAEIACELMVGKNYDQARRISAELIDKNARDKDTEEAFPKETHAHLNLILSAIDHAAEQCTDLPLPDTYIAKAPKHMKCQCSLAKLAT